jgi:hypothetical protein
VNKNVRVCTSGVWIPERQQIYLFSVMSGLLLGPQQPLTQWVTCVVTPQVKRQSHEADQSPPCIAEVKNCTAIASLSHTSSWHSAELPITVAARSKAWIVFGRSNTDNRGFKPYSRHGCLSAFILCIVLCVGWGLAMDRSPFQGVLSTVYTLRNLNSGQCSHGL